MHWFYTFCLPIILGIATTVVLWVLNRLFFEVVLPRYKEWIYTGMTVGGTWKALYPADRDRNHIVCQEIMVVEQLADKVKGSIAYAELSKEGASIIKQKQFAFEGTFVDQVLSARYWNRERNDNGRGTFCLIVKDADNLVGKYSWLDPDTHKVEASDYVWAREA